MKGNYNVKEYICSKYNIIFELNKENYLLFNTANGTILLLNKSEVDYLNNINSLNNESIEKYLELGVIVDANLNESHKLIKRINSELCGNEKLSFVIAPTMRCNYKCIYCFEENKITNDMDTDIALSVVKFITDRVGVTTKEIHITWFGGEPTLNLPIIKIIGENIKRFLLDKNVIFTSSIVSNGVLLSKKVCKELIEFCNLTTVQITIDGLAKTYCKLKQTNENNFNQVISNIQDCCELVNYNIRLNANKNNYLELIKLCDYLMIEKNLKNKINIYFAQLRDYKNSNYHDEYFNDIDYYSYKKQFNTLLVKKGYQTKKILPPPAFNWRWCGLYKQNNFAIDPNGNIYRCEHELAIDGCKIGNVKIKKKLEKKLFFNEKCQKCNLFPSCPASLCHIIFKFVNFENGKCSLYDDIYNIVKDRCIEFYNHNK